MNFHYTFHKLNPTATTLDTFYEHECHLDNLEKLHPPSSRADPHLPSIKLHASGFTRSSELTMVLQPLPYFGSQ
jgi:hypothetical protein